MSEQIAKFRDSPGADRTAMFDPRVLLLLGLVGPEYVGLDAHKGALLLEVFLPRHKMRPPTAWRPK